MGRAFIQGLTDDNKGGVPGMGMGERGQGVRKGFWHLHVVSLLLRYPPPAQYFPPNQRFYGKICRRVAEGRSPSFLFLAPRTLPYPTQWQGPAVSAPGSEATGK